LETKRRPRTAVIIIVMAAVVGVCASIALWRSPNATVDDFGPAFDSAVTSPSRAPARLGQWGKQLQRDHQAMVAAQRESRKPPALPIRLEIPALSLSAPIDPVGVDERGLTDIPEDGDRVGWYRYGVRPGASEGSAVLIGHRDTVAQGPGALFTIGDLSAGDKITVVTANAEITYQVVARQSFDKQSLPDRLFERIGAHRLTLITCGGSYLPEAGGYQENIVVTAKLVPAPDRATQ
jgi:LPXTG-site transpeptidase (sortase) family protein